MSEVDITDVMSLVMHAYANEPCRVCRRLITDDETRNIVFSGYVEIDGKVSRASHAACWRDLSPDEKERMREETLNGSKADT